jgi:hypothetical protein
MKEGENGDDTVVEYGCSNHIFWNWGNTLRGSEVHRVYSDNELSQNSIPFP